MIETQRKPKRYSRIDNLETLATRHMTKTSKEKGKEKEKEKEKERTQHNTES